MKKNPFLWSLAQVKKRILAIAALTAAQAGNALFSVFFALGSRAVIDSAQSGNRELFVAACIQQGLIIAGILTCLTAQRHLRDRLRADLEKDWKKRLLHGLLHGEYADVSAYHSGELLNRLNNDVNKVNEGILLVFPNALAMIIRMVAAAIVLGTLDGTFAAVVLTVGAVVVLATAFLRRWLKELNKKVSHHDGKVSAFLQEMMEKLLMVQSMDVSAEVERRADLLLEERYVLQRKRKNVSLLTNTGISVMFHGAGFVALIWCAWRMLMGQMSFGSLTAVIQLVNQLQTPFVSLSGVLPQYVATLASAERLMELDRICVHAEAEAKDAEKIYQETESIRAENLTFSYGRERILQDASMDIPKGAFCVITGHSGIGKSTLLKLLLGVFQPESGKLFVQTSAEEIPLDRSTRRLFAYVPQGNLLLSGTLRENLLIAKPDATKEQLEQAIFVSAMDEYLPMLPHGLDTALGESGAGLSEGQAQRLAIARAVLGGAPILLLDESTSALDAQTEKMVLERIFSLKDRTCIAVTHRSAAEQLCDWKLEIRGGKIITIPNDK